MKPARALGCRDGRLTDGQRAWRGVPEQRIEICTTIAVGYGSDLSDWTTAVARPDVVITPPPGSPTDAIEVKIRLTLATGDKLFARIKVVVTP